LGAAEGDERALTPSLENPFPGAGGLVRPLTFTSRFWPSFLFLTMALSTIVQREPAPYDFLLLAGMLLFLLSGQRVPLRLAWPGILVLLVLCGYAVGTMFAMDQEISFLYMRTSAYLSISLLFFAALIFSAPERNVTAIANGLVVASIIAASLGVLGYFGAIPNAGAFALYGRASGPFKDPNVFGPSLIFPALYLVHRMAARPLREMLWTLPVLLLLMLALFLSFSRGAWMDGAASALAFFVLIAIHAPSWEKRRLAGLSVVLFAFGALAILWALSRPEVRALFLQRFTLAQDYDSGEGGRFDNMFEAFQMALRYPLGIGPEQWPKISPSGLMPHNIYVNVFVSGGLISLIGFGGLTVLTFWSGLRALRFSPPLQGVLIAAIAAFFGHALEGLLIDSNHWRHIYVLAGIIWGLSAAAEIRGRMGIEAPNPAPSLPLQSRHG
jgi:O-Antigen ligase